MALALLKKKPQPAINYNRLGNYTFLTSEIVLRVLNVCADPKEQHSKVHLLAE